MGKYRVSVDVGGTFTDLLALEEKTGNTITVKVPSTPNNPSSGVLDAFQQFFKLAKHAEIQMVVHATTIAVNALMGQLHLELPKTALITSKGFKDVIEIRRQSRHELYNLFVQKPRVLIPRKLRFEVDERVGPCGKVLKCLSKPEVHSLINELGKIEADSIAITLLHSFANPKHEKQVKASLKKKLPETFVSASFEVAPEHREYERTSTTVVNACLMPIISTYVNRLESGMQSLGVKSPLYVMRSDGGIASKKAVAEKPVSIIESGPAAGVTATAFIAKILKTTNVLSFDMGGTTAKAGIIRDYKPETVSEYEVAGKVHSGRIVKGSGYPVRYPFIDIAECSAGGGSIAWVDAGGGLKVGPISAGASPGPACYGLGGENPTVTDANLILGRLNQAYLLGGKMRVSPKYSEKAVRKISEHLNMGLTEVAIGIIKIINSEMAKILRIVTVERGYDPRKFTMMCFGGAGPMHACALAEELQIRKIIVPLNPGIFSAFGLLATDFKCNFSKSVIKTADQVNYEDIESDFQSLQTQGEIMMKKQGARNSLEFHRHLEMRYEKQGYELSIPVPSRLTRKTFSETIKGFHSKHKSIYGYEVIDSPVEIVNARLTVLSFVVKPKVQWKQASGEKPSSESLHSTRRGYFEREEGYVETPVYIREKLKPKNVVQGPAVIEQYDATTVVYPEWEVSVDNLGNLVMLWGQEGSH